MNIFSLFKKKERIVEEKVVEKIEKEDDYLDIYFKLKHLKVGDILYSLKHKLTFNVEELPRFYRDINEDPNVDIVLLYKNARKEKPDWYFNFIVFLRDDEDDDNFRDFGMLETECHYILNEFILNSEYNKYHRNKVVKKLLDNDTE